MPRDTKVRLYFESGSQVPWYLKIEQFNDEPPLNRYLGRFG